MSGPFAANAAARRRLDRLRPRRGQLRIRFDPAGSVADFGVNAAGGLEAGLELARLSLGDLGRVRLVLDRSGDGTARPAVQVRSDQPLVACMGCQYGGWQVQADRYFAIGSGPMRLLRGREPVLEQYALKENATSAVGVLETAALPEPALIRSMAGECGVDTAGICLCVAPTRSLAGTIQIVARSLEATMHKLHEIGADLSRVSSGWGIAPLPPVAADDLVAIGRTNDAILYGGRVWLWVDLTDGEIRELGPKTPSSASPDFGRHFEEIFRDAGGDFYKLDPMLFSAAEVTFISLRTGNTFRFGKTVPELVP